MFHNSTNWLSVPLGELTVKAWKWPINFTLLMNVIEGIYSTIAYILVTFEAYVFLYNHDTNDILPLWPYFMYEIIVLVGKSPSNTVNESWKYCCRPWTPLGSGINNSHKLFWSYTTYYILYNHDSNTFVPFSAFLLNNYTACFLLTCIIHSHMVVTKAADDGIWCSDVLTNFKLNMLEIVKL